MVKLDWQTKIASADRCHASAIRCHNPLIPQLTCRVRTSHFDSSAITQVPCYTESVGEIKQNLTLVIEEDLLLAARKIALDQRTSVNQLVRDYLAALVEEPNRRRLARTRLNKMFETGLVTVGEKTWTRDDLYER